MESGGAVEKRGAIPYNRGDFTGEVQAVNSTQIQCFLSVARMQSFSRAAQALYLTQPSVSRYIGQLEREWGVELFQRRGRNVVLTPQGEEYYRLCLRCQGEFADLRRKHMAAGDQASLSLQYSVFPAWSISKLLYEGMEEVKGRHANWDISLRLCPAGALVDNLLRGQVDVIFTVGGVLRHHQELEVRPLLELPQIILYSNLHPLAKKPALTPRDFAGEEFLFVPDEVLTSEMIARQAKSVERRYGFPMRTRLLADTDELTLALELGQGVALMDVWSRYQNNAVMKQLPIDLPVPVVLAWRRDSGKRALTQFAQEMADFFRRQAL